MLGPRELADLRNAAAKALPDTVTIKRRTLISDGHLGQTETWVTIAEHVPCRIDENEEGRGEVDVAARAASTGVYNVRLPYGTALNEADRIEVVSTSRVRSLEVSRVIETSYGTTLTVRCAEVR